MLHYTCIVGTVLFPETYSSTMTVQQLQKLNNSASQKYEQDRTRRPQSKCMNNELDHAHVFPFGRDRKSVASLTGIRAQGAQGSIWFNQEVIFKFQSPNVCDIKKQ